MEVEMRTIDALLAQRAERFDDPRESGTFDTAAVLHDARTPLTVIAASAGMALDSAPEELRPHIERIRASARLLEQILVRGLTRLRANPEGTRAADLGALLLAAAALPHGGKLTLQAEVVRDDSGAPFSVRAVVEGEAGFGSEVPAAARRAVLRHGGSLWVEETGSGATRYIAEIPPAATA